MTTLHAVLAGCRLAEEIEAVVAAAVQRAPTCPDCNCNERCGLCVEVYVLVAALAAIGGPDGSVD